MRLEGCFDRTFLHKSWHTVSETVNVNFRYANGEMLSGMMLFPKNYDTIEDLLWSINEYFQKMAVTADRSRIPQFAFEQGTGRIYLQGAIFEPIKDAFPGLNLDPDTDLGVVFPDIGEELFGVLGFEYPLKIPRRKRGIGKSTIVSERPCDLRGGRYNLMVYSDIVEPSIVGDK